MREWKNGEGSIEIGGRKINDFTANCNYSSYTELRQLIGVISEDNFFRNGSLKENVSWNVPHFDEFQADLFAKELQID
jgi:ABC-type bacteriocin/lantibiotic exporter with double-glycine peptidase domain